MDTAVIVVDMWDRHYCRTYEQRMGELAERMNPALRFYRENGVPIIFMAAWVANNYTEHPGYQELRKYRHLQVGDVVPVDYPLPPGVDTWWQGCLCEDERCPDQGRIWTKLHPALEVEDTDFIGSLGAHYGWLKQHNNIKRLLFAGGALNVCVLYARPFSVIYALGAGYKCTILEDLVEAFQPGYTREEGLQVTLDYYRQHICPTVKWHDSNV